MNKPPVFAILLALSAILMTSCFSVPEEISTDLEPREYLQEAQEAFDEGNFEASMLYLETFLERFPNDIENGYSARYQIAFIHYKKGEYDIATEKFNNIIADYDEESEDKPEWVLILSEKILATITEITAEQEPTEAE